MVKANPRGKIEKNKYFFSGLIKYSSKKLIAQISSGNKIISNLNNSLNSTSGGKKFNNIRTVKIILV